jgi:hypothetical protein
MRPTHKPLKSLSRLLCILLKAYVCIQSLRMAADIWSHYSLKSSIRTSLAQTGAELGMSKEELQSELEALAAKEKSVKTDRNATLFSSDQVAALAASMLAEDTTGDAFKEGSGGAAVVPPESLATLREANRVKGSGEVFVEKVTEVASRWWETFKLVSSLGLLVASFSLYAITGILFLKWVYRATRNLQAFSGTTLNYTPTWAAASYFVPVVAIFVPPAAMSEIWTASHKSSTRSLVPLWWTLVVLSSLTGQMFSTTFDQAKGLEFLTSDKIFFFQCLSQLVSIALIATTASLVAQVAAAYSLNITENLTPLAEEHVSPPTPI